MNSGDRLRIIIILSYILLIVCAIILFIGLWNKLSMNTEVQVGNGLYFLVLSMLVLSSVIFTIYMLEQSRESYTFPEERDLEREPLENTTPIESASYLAPFDVDLDLLAEQIIPRIDFREETEAYAERILQNIAGHFGVVQGVFFLKDRVTGLFESVSTYAYTADDGPSPFKVGEGINGQVAKNRILLHLTSIPEGYLKIRSGLGNSAPSNLLIVPLLLNKETIGIIELASFKDFDQETRWTFKNLAKMIGNAMITKIKAAEKQ